MRPKLQKKGKRSAVVDDTASTSDSDALIRRLGKKRKVPTREAVAAQLRLKAAVIAHANGLTLSELFPEIVASRRRRNRKAPSSS